MAPQRLSKILAAAGVASRRASEQLIFDGKVTVNGEKILVPQTHVELGVDDICVDGQSISKAEGKKYYILNKPHGYHCTNKEGRTKKIVVNLFKSEGLRLFTVGRLDRDTTGLLLVTNDGHFANEVIHPSSNVQKEYVLKADQEITDDHLEKMREGCIVEGVFVKPCSVKKVRKGTVKVTVKEGRKREVRCLAKSAGLKVLELSRIRIGGLKMGDLPLGQWREMTEAERKGIFQ